MKKKSDLQEKEEKLVMEVTIPGNKINDQPIVHSGTTKVDKQTSDMQGLEEDHEDISYMHPLSMKLGHHFERSSRKTSEGLEQRDPRIQKCWAHKGIGTKCFCKNYQI